jgi:hypothetical protein
VIDEAPSYGLCDFQNRGEIESIASLARHDTHRWLWGRTVQSVKCIGRVDSVISRDDHEGSV